MAALRRGSHPPRITPPSLRLPREAITGAQVGNILCLADRLAQIREEVKAEAREMGRRRYIASSIGTVDKPLSINRRALSRPAPLQVASSDQPIAPSREPCPRCATRGDLGCAHQLPMERVEDQRLGKRG